MIEHAKEKKQRDRGLCLVCEHWAQIDADRGRCGNTQCDTYGKITHWVHRCDEWDHRENDYVNVPTVRR